MSKALRKIETFRLRALAPLAENSSARTPDWRMDLQSRSRSRNRESALRIRQTLTQGSYGKHLGSVHEPTELAGLVDRVRNKVDCI